MARMPGQPTKSGIVLAKPGREVTLSASHCILPSVLLHREYTDRDLVASLQEKTQVSDPYSS